MDKPARSLFNPASLIFGGGGDKKVDAKVDRDAPVRVQEQARPTPPNVQQTFNVSVTGVAGNADEVAERVSRKVAESTAETMRGQFADLGFA